MQFAPRYRCVSSEHPDNPDASATVIEHGQRLTAAHRPRQHPRAGWPDHVEAQVKLAQRLVVTQSPEMAKSSAGRAESPPCPRAPSSGDSGSGFTVPGR
eukprot:3494283-Rhodomonas_salina.1